MPRIIGLDKIGTLSHSAGVITLGPSLLSIGGQQYRVLSSITRTIATDVTMTANTRYQIFAVLSGGAVALRISANENSAGPAGFNSWKLVGSFYANGMPSVAFGSFVTIEGSPTTGLVPYSPTMQGVASYTHRGLAWQRFGKTVVIQSGFTSGTTSGSEFRLPTPGNLTIDSAYSTTEFQPFGKLSRYVGSTGSKFFQMSSVAPRNYFTISNLYRDDSANMNGAFNASTAFSSGELIGVEIQVNLNDWSVTPIKDL